MPLDIQPTKFNDVLEITPKIHNDSRGYFSEVFRVDELYEARFPKPFIQENQSLSTAAYTLRGFHFQTPPHAQDKLIRVLQGAILDVVVDIRTGSSTYGQHISIELSSQNFKQLLIPAGFAHAFLTLLPDTLVAYKVTRRYAPDNDSGIIWNDPNLNIQWPIPTTVKPTLSEKDTQLPRFTDIPTGLFPFNDHTA